MTLVHTSDWHLGCRFHDCDRTAEHIAFLKMLKETVRDSRADALLVSGDIFDVRQPSPAAQSLYYDFLAEMEECEICSRIIVIAGNHDSSSLLSASGNALRRIGVEVVAKAGLDAAREVVVVPGRDGTPGLAIAAIPFMNDGELANFARAAGDDDDTGGCAASARLERGFAAHCSCAIAAARAAASGAPVVAMAHCALAGAAVSDGRSERGREVGGLASLAPDAFKGADYVALGHLHLPQRLGPDGRFAYSGAPLKMSFSETAEPKSVNIVRFGEDVATPPEITKVTVPETVAMKRLSGSPRTIRDALAALAASRPPKTYVSLRVTEGEGSLDSLWIDADEIVRDTGALVLLKEDGRETAPRTASLAAESSRRTLAAMTPLEIAKLRIGEETSLSEAERDEFIAMAAKAAAEAE